MTVRSLKSALLMPGFPACTIQQICFTGSKTMHSVFYLLGITKNPKPAHCGVADNTKCFMAVAINHPEGPEEDREGGRGCRKERWLQWD